MILLDTSGLLAALFADQNQHEECARVLREAEPPFVLSPFVLAESDHLIQKYAGGAAERLFLSEVARGAYQLIDFTLDDLKESLEVIEKYRDLNIGLADASIVALANHFDCRDILTLDLRHFRALRPLRKRRFRLLPADAR